MTKYLILGFLLVPAAGLAQPPADGARAARSGSDPNQIICRRQQRLGTRLDVERVCMTRAQWAENHRLTRESVDHVQMSRAASGN